MKHIFLSQSISKYFGLYIMKSAGGTSLEIEKEDVCPARIKSLIFDGFQQEATEAMLRGQYFETMAIGGGRDGKLITDLPRKVDGGKTAAHKRIDKQVERFKKYLDAHNIGVNDKNTQVPLIMRFGARGGFVFWITGVMDMFPVKRQDEILIVDLKLTGNVHSDFFSYKQKWKTAQSCWGNPDLVAINQAITYHKLARNMDINVLKQWKPEESDKYDFVASDRIKDMIEEGDPAFEYWVFGTAPENENNGKQSKIVRVENSEDVDRIFYVLFNAVIDLFLKFNEQNWPENPVDVKICATRCPLKNSCKKFNSNTL